MNTMQGWAFKGLRMCSGSFPIGLNGYYTDAYGPIGKVKGSDLYHWATQIEDYTRVSC